MLGFLPVVCCPSTPGPGPLYGSRAKEKLIFVGFFAGRVLSKYTRTGPSLCYTGEEKADWNEQGVILGNPRKRKSIFCIYSIKKMFFLCII